MNHLTNPGLAFWFGFLIIPRVFIAILAFYWYIDTNPILVVLTVLGCFIGEILEKLWLCAPK